MVKVLLVDESQTSLDIMGEHLARRFPIELLLSGSIEDAFEQFCKDRPPIIILEIVLPHSKGGQMLLQNLKNQERQIFKEGRELEGQPINTETAEKDRALSGRWAINFMMQTATWDLSGGLALVQQIKNYCEEKSLPMPKVIFYTTQSPYDHLRALAELFKSQEDYFWFSKLGNLDRFIATLKEQIALASV